MDLRRLRYFMVAAEQENFNRAARILHVSQPALSRLVSSLEQELGIPLFKRLPRGVALTSGGRFLLAQAKRILELVDETQYEIEQIKAGKSGVLRVAYMEIGARTALLQASLTRFRAVSPNVALKLGLMASSQQLQALDNELLDAGFLYDDPEFHPELRFELVGSHHPVIGVSRTHRLATRKTILLADLQEEHFIGLSRTKHPLSADRLFEACGAGGLVQHIVQEVDDTDTRVALVSVGAGIGFFHPLLLAGHERDVVSRRVEDLDFQWPLYLVWRRDNASPAVRRYIEIALDLLSKERAAAGVRARRPDDDSLSGKARRKVRGNVYKLK